MKIDIEKIRYSKCPACNKHGIPAFFKFGYRHTYTVECKYCHKKFKIPNLFAFIWKITTIIFVVLFSIYIIALPFWLLAILVALLSFLFDYFGPLTEVDDEE